jgi:hypothetical protein
MIRHLIRRHSGRIGKVIGLGLSEKKKIRAHCFQQGDKK